MSKVGFLVNGENFAWSQRGLVKVKELRAEDLVLGIDERGKPYWSPIPDGIRKHRRMSCLRITTDQNEILLPEICEVFTIEGVRKVSNISKGELLETINIPQQVRVLLEGNKTAHVMTNIGPVTISTKLAYLLGTQVKSRKYAQRVIVKGLNPAHAYELAKICSDSLKEQFIRGKIYYFAGGRGVRIDCGILASICADISEKNIPLYIRESSAIALKEFLCGILDIMLYFDEAETPTTYFQTLKEQSELRRFLFNILRLYGIIPVKTYVYKPSDTPMYMRTFVEESNLSKLGLKFIRSDKVVIAKPPIGKMTYSTVRNIEKFKDLTYYISEPKLHWSPIIELTPLHRHALL